MPTEKGNDVANNLHYVSQLMLAQREASECGFSNTELAFSVLINFENMRRIELELEFSHE